MSEVDAPRLHGDCDGLMRDDDNGGNERGLLEFERGWRDVELMLRLPRVRVTVLGRGGRLSSFSTWQLSASIDEVV